VRRLISAVGDPVLSERVAGAGRLAAQAYSYDEFRLRWIAEFERVFEGDLRSAR